jgi:Mn-dependent DtxR family transcriptional regulator
MRISEMGNDDYAFLIAIHELIEWYLTEKHGIQEKDIKAFDEAFEKERLQGLHTEKEEAGFDPHAPYIKEHSFATNIEKEIAKELGIDWATYSKEITALFTAFEASENTKAGGEK